MQLTREFEDYLVMVTRNGTVKRLEMTTLNTNRKGGIRALTLDEGDELMTVLKTSGTDKIISATKNGMAICFDAQEVRPMGRDAAGVRGIRLTEDDQVVGAVVAREGMDLLTVTELGYGKRTDVVEYHVQGRGGKGMKNYNLTDKTGRVVGVQVVNDDNDVMLIEDNGIIIRMAASDINRYKRDTQGVRVMRVEDGARVISVQAAEKDEAEEAAEEPAE